MFHLDSFMVEETESWSHSRKVLLSHASLRAICTTNDHYRRPRTCGNLPKIVRIPEALSRRNCPDVWHFFWRDSSPRQSSEGARPLPLSSRPLAIARENHAEATPAWRNLWQTIDRMDEKKRWARYLLEEFGETRGRAAATKLLLERARTKRQLEVRAPPRN